MESADTVLIALYLVALSGLSLHAILGLATLWVLWRNRHRQPFTTPPPLSAESYPRVTIQLPLYNERFVVERLLNAVTQLDYPRDRLQIQVLDDSTDDTADFVAEQICHYQREGVDIVCHHRQERLGFKAGALAEATEKATGEFIAIFDADFVPSADFLHRTVPYLVDNPRLACVQGCWQHLNRHDSLLTELEAIALDKHFALEQPARSLGNLFPKFNGSAGVWRISAIRRVGNWLDLTACEDLCLSNRAILQGWQILYLPDVAVTGELPNTVNSYKEQQARWAEGSTQCLRHYFRPILASHFSWFSKLYALLAMGGYLTNLFFLLALLLQPFLVWQNVQPPRLTLLFTLLGLTHPLLYLMAQYQQHPRTAWQAVWRLLPLFLLAGGCVPSQVKGVWQGFFGRANQFVRTPKGAGQFHRYGTSQNRTLGWELLLLGYSLGGLIYVLALADYGAAVWLLSGAIGCAWVISADLPLKSAEVESKEKDNKKTQSHPLPSKRGKMSG